MADTSNSSDVLSIRDVIERYEELEDERGMVADYLKEKEEAYTVDFNDPDGSTQEELAEKIKEATQELTAWDEENGDEFKALKDLLDELCGNGSDHQWKGDWYPLSLIRDNYFVAAMQELVYDIGMPKDIPNYLVIDWDATADNFQADYTSVEYDGVTYWYR